MPSALVKTNYPRIFDKIFNEPWAITKPAYESIRQTFLAHEKGQFPNLPQNEADAPSAWNGQITFTAENDAPFPTAAASLPNAFFFQDEEEPPASQEPIAKDGVLILPVSGIIGKRLSSLETMCGGVDVDAIRGSLAAALESPTVETVVLHFDSPGGTVTGVPELAGEILRQAMDSGKRIVSYTDTLMASAAYWLASQSHEIYAAPSATVGSIGVRISLVDASQHNAALGLKYYTIKSGDLKDMGDPSRPMTSEETALLQSQVDAIGADFRDAINHVRPSVQADSMRGQTFAGDEAADRALVDGLFDTLADLTKTL